MSFGENVKKARKSKSLSLQELSDRCGVSRSMLSQIERGEKNPTIQVACQIAEGLDMTLSQLLGEDARKEVIVIKKEERYIYKDKHSGFERHLLSPSFPSRGIEFILNIIPYKKASGIFPKHKKGVKEYISVAKGKLRVKLGNETYDLEEGDSMYYEADIEHSFTNIGDEDCHYYLVIDSNNVYL
ncbi:XRE family transcriptional regulator (plasmid) [Geobacillus thermoleovorans]|uniref:XRE family transcriptional regulator n=1 Tax=Geobacillus thermoleovorans TaxID=33941 RepID=A0A2Z3NDR4_GEOTH|nr:XRE family transcriptional regulator [Geobacillus thermoleovorans]AWO76592.1 XRE family transcriptional regulator [Geobacillus thermoleovorans]